MGASIDLNGEQEQGLNLIIALGISLACHARYTAGSDHGIASYGQFLRGVSIATQPSHLVCMSFHSTSFKFHHRKYLLCIRHFAMK
jgi:hypothetical protein